MQGLGYSTVLVPPTFPQEPRLHAHACLPSKFYWEHKRRAIRCSPHSTRLTLGGQWPFQFSFLDSWKGKSWGTEGEASRQLLPRKRITGQAIISCPNFSPMASLTRCWIMKRESRRKQWWCESLSLYWWFYIWGVGAFILDSGYGTLEFEENAKQILWDWSLPIFLPSFWSTWNWMRISYEEKLKLLNLYGILPCTSWGIKTSHILKGYKKLVKLSRKVLEVLHHPPGHLGWTSHRMLLVMYYQWQPPFIRYDF